MDQSNVVAPLDSADLLVPANVVYQSGSGAAGAMTARLGTSRQMPILRGRSRAYPGLVSEAPPTYAYYRAAATHLAGARRIVDVGCGAGLGTRLLARLEAEITAVDVDESALAFVQHLAPRAHALRTDLARPLDIPACDGALAIDVLGHVVDPLRVLMSVRDSLVPGATILVAEPKASPAQYLRHPARRAFSRPSLTALLTVGGFEVREWLSDEGTFLCGLATASADPAYRRLAEASNLVAKGAAAPALAAYRAAGETANRALRLESALGRGELHFALREGDAAVASFLEAREVDPTDARPFASLAQVSLAVGELDDAAQLAESARRIDPTEIAAVCAAAMVSDRLGAGLSQPRWLTASNLSPDHVTIGRIAADGLLQRGEYAEALWVLDRVQRFGDDHGAALHLAIAAVHEAAGRPTDAALEARLAAARDPENPQVLELLARLRTNDSSAARQAQSTS